MTTLIPKFEQTGSTTNRPINLKLAETVSVLDFGADPTGAADSTTALQNAINFCQTNKKTLLINGGTYQTTAALVINNTYGQGLTVIGEGEGTSVIQANHTGTAVISMIGAINCTLSNFTVFGGLPSATTTIPKCGIITGRSSANSAGWHTFLNIGVTGAFSVAGIYNIASEGNCWYDLFVICDAPYGVFISGIDNESVGGLTASTMLGANFYGANIYINKASVSVASIFIQGAIGTGQIAFFGGYLVSAGGSYVTLNTSGQDNSDSLGPFIFDGLNSEPVASANCIGFNLTGGIASSLRQLTISNCIFRTGTANFITKSTAVGFIDANIQGMGIVTANSFASLAPSTFGSTNFWFNKSPPATGDGNNYNSTVDVGFGVIPPTSQAVTLAGAWVNTFSTGNGFGLTGFVQNSNGTIYLTGAPSDGISGTLILTLPDGARPQENKRFYVYSNTGAAVIYVATDGKVTHESGGTTPVYLTGISFVRAY